MKSVTREKTYRKRYF